MVAIVKLASISAYLYSLRPTSKYKRQVFLAVEPTLSYRYVCASDVFRYTSGVILKSFDVPDTCGTLFFVVLLSYCRT